MTQGGDDIIILSEIGDADTAVVLLGWYGSSSIHLNKYSNTHLKKGRSTLALTLSHSAVFGRNADVEQKSILLDISKCIAANFPTHRIIFHAFSNGGAFCLRWLSELEDDYRALATQTSHAIIDSAPAYLSVTSGSRALAYGTGLVKHKNSWLENILKIPFGLFMLSRRAVVGEYWRQWEEWSVENCAVLFLYSMDDELTDGVKLEALIDKKKGAKSHKFVNSKHVQHLRMHADNYVRVVEEFLNE